jgi:hypothetical protein
LLEGATPNPFIDAQACRNYGQEMKPSSMRASPRKKLRPARLRQNSNVGVFAMKSG